MLIPEEGYTLRLLFDENTKYDRKPLYQWIVETAHAEGLLQAIVLRGLMGYVPNGKIHTSKIEVLSLELPILVEIVDTRAKLEKYLGTIKDVIAECSLTVEMLPVTLYGTRGRRHER